MDKCHERLSLTRPSEATFSAKLMTTRSRQVVLIADDDPDGRLLAEEAFRECGFDDRLFIVSDGDDLLDFLSQRGSYVGAPRPDLILLDLNMPKMAGGEVLRRIKADEGFKTIPVVALTTSDAEEDVIAVYGLGASSYVTKPPSFDDFVELIRKVRNYWFETVRLPSRREGRQ